MKTEEKNYQNEETKVLNNQVLQNKTPQNKINKDRVAPKSTKSENGGWDKIAIGGIIGVMLGGGGVYAAEHLSGMDIMGATTDGLSDIMGGASDSINTAVADADSLSVSIGSANSENIVVSVDGAGNDNVTVAVNDNITVAVNEATPTPAPTPVVDPNNITVSVTGAGNENITVAVNEATPTPEPTPVVDPNNITVSVAGAGNDNITVAVNDNITVAVNEATPTPAPTPVVDPNNIVVSVAGAGNDNITVAVNEATPTPAPAPVVDTNNIVVSVAGAGSENITVAVNETGTNISVESPYTIDSSIQVAQVNNTMSFGQAFAEARAQVGSGGTFEWNGRLFSTYTAEEWDSMTNEQRTNFGNSANYNSNYAQNNNNNVLDAEVVETQVDVLDAEVAEAQVDTYESSDEVLDTPQEDVTTPEYADGLMFEGDYDDSLLAQNDDGMYDYSNDADVSDFMA